MSDYLDDETKDWLFIPADWRCRMAMLFSLLFWSIVLLKLFGLVAIGWKLFLSFSFAMLLLMSIMFLIKERS